MLVRRGLTAGAAGAVLALTGTVAVSAPATAAPTRPFAQLSIQSTSSPDFFTVIVSGNLGVVPDGTPVSIVLKGDDPVFDDVLDVSLPSTTFSHTFSAIEVVFHGKLNEDWEGRDEVYARIIAPGIPSFTTNVVTGFF